MIWHYYECINAYVALSHKVSKRVSDYEFKLITLQQVLPSEYGSRGKVCIGYSVEDSHGVWV